MKMVSFGQSVSLNKEEIAEVKDHFKKDYGVEPNVSTVSPTIGKELAKNAMLASLFHQSESFCMFRFDLNGVWRYLLSWRYP